ncbi:hypothetical protein AAC978_12510 [Desulfitobacterium sp. THU1]|uniref:hypothetical protein n=1 Tax=Desulfitobacterium sp. THU1 TaxID=3138072 RepID=UPI00311E53AB
MISNRVDAPEEATTAYARRWRIEVFYRMAKQNLGLTSCYAQPEAAHFAHVELLFTAKTLLCYADGCAIKKAPNKPHPSAKWSGTFSTPIVGFAVASSRSKSILTQQPSVFQGLA